tara:strand:+ start:439 stop:549 length:111 start_codon:yes stop_codon:yes gene_type:complete
MERLTLFSAMMPSSHAVSMVFSWVGVGVRVRARVSG